MLSLEISEKDLADFAFNGLCSYLKEKLEGFEFKLKNAKDTYKPHRSNTHILDHDSDSSDDESKEVYAAVFIWPSKAKPCSVPSLNPIQKNRQEELKFTFDVSKCNLIFDELLKNGNIRLSHAIPSPEEFKRHAYCKWHNSTSHATNDYNFSVDRYNRPLIKDD